MTMAPPDLEHDAETREHARGQVDAVRLHTDHTNSVLDELRLAAENLLSIHTRAMTYIDEVPAYSVDLPDMVEGHYADPQAQVRISQTVLSLLGSFGAPRVNDLVAGVDATQAALRRYADTAAADFDREYGPKGWESIDEVKARIFAGAVRDECPVKGCDRTDAHAFLLLTEDGHRHLADVAPPASGDFACCASGSCEVCKR